MNKTLGVIIQSVTAALCASHLVAVDHEVVRGDEWLKHDHPAGVGGPLKEWVGQLGNIHVHLVGAVDQIWHNKKTKC